MLISVPPSIAAASAAPAAFPRPPLPGLPARLASQGYYAVNSRGIPAIVPPLVAVAAGSFIMGSAESDPLANGTRNPDIASRWQRFRSAKYPVTVAEYALAVRAGAVREPKVDAIAWQTQFQQSDHPVVGVRGRMRWPMSPGCERRRVRRAGGSPPKRSGRRRRAGMRNAGCRRIYPWGDDFDKDRCNTSASDLGATTPIGSYPASDAFRGGASPWGAEDMAGNVWEWTSSQRTPYPYAEGDGREGADSTEPGVLRGGSWGSQSQYARTACRGGSHGVDSADFTVGFRLVLAQPAP